MSSPYMRPSPPIPPPYLVPPALDIAAPLSHTTHMTTNVAPTKLSMADINRYKIARETGYDIGGVSRIFDPKYPRIMGSLRAVFAIAATLGVTTDEFIAFLREECGKDI